MNVLVAGMLGWTKLRRVQPAYMPMATVYGYPPGMDYESALPDFSGDIRAAWPLVERFEMSIHAPYEGSPGWTVEILDSGFPGIRVDRADTAPHAICLAALQATASPSS